MPNDFITQAQTLFNLTLTDAQVNAFEILLQELITWNEQMNLTAITEPDAVRVRHFLDSLSLDLTTDFNAEIRVLDVGTGAGFPGLVLAVMYPQAHITMMDSTGKKLKFIDHMISKLGLTNARTLHARAEEAGQDSAHRAKYDVVVARAVARLPALLEYCLPFCRVDGLFIAMKGTTAFDEIEDAAEAMRVLGGQVDDVVTVQLPDMDYPHYLIMVEKVKPTPKGYPRKAGIPTREPIEEPDEEE
jgi:16S rRNA (guanine527-N7)-methyltransferase